MSRAALPLAPARPFGRRRTLEALGALGAPSALGLLGCGDGGGTDDSSDAGTSTGTVGSSETSSSCQVIPEETAGPYPADGSNASNRRYNVLALAGIVRSDLRSSVGSTVQATGVPITLQITLTGAARSCEPLAGYAISMWHCMADGNHPVTPPAT